MSYTLRKVNTPTAIIKPTSKISFALAFDGSDSASNIQGNSLTYAWSVTPAAGVTIATPAAATTTINVPSGPGEFVVTLTVTDSTTLLTDSTTYTVKTDRVIDINGVSEDNNSLITSLQTAFNWITANDVGNATNYLINVYSTTTDAVRIVPVAGVKVVFQANGKLPVGVDFGAGAFQWGGTTKNQSQTHITGAAVNIAALLISGTNVIAPVISNNVFDENVTYGMMAFNTNNTSFLCTNNYFQGSIAAAFSTNTLVAPPVALAFANAPMFNNVFNTIVTGFVMAPGTAVLPGENIRV